MIICHSVPPYPTPFLNICMCVCVAGFCRIVGFNRTKLLRSIRLGTLSILFHWGEFWKCSFGRFGVQLCSCAWLERQLQPNIISYNTAMNAAVAMQAWVKGILGRIFFEQEKTATCIGIIWLWKTPAQACLIGGVDV